MRTALLAKSKRTRISRQRTYPAPIGGWNDRDSPFNLPPLDSDQIVNWYPRTSYLEKRGGTTAHATGMTGTCQTLATYSSLSGSESLWGCTGSGIYNVSASGAVGAAAIARTSAKHQWTMFGDGTSNWICLFNGVDKPAFYDGTTWTAVDAASTPAITGVTTTGLIGAMSYQGRLFLIEKDKLKFWYLTAGAVGGAATSFDLTAQCSRGGYLSEALPFTYDGGSGLEDSAIFLTNMGEAIVYNGTDPSDATKWSKKGTYFVGKPVSRKSMVKVGGDVFILTESGVVRMSSAMQGITTTDQFYISDKIRNILNYNAANGIGQNWEIFAYMKENALIINQPNAQQYVMNMATGSWALFDWSAECFGVLSNQLYWGKSTYTRKAWTGTSDADSVSNTITAYAKTAHFNFGSQDRKEFKFGRLNIIGTASALIYGLFYVDGLPQNSGNTTELMTVTSTQSNLPFKCPANTGVYFSLYLQEPGSTSTPKWYATTFAYEDGSIL